MTDTRRPLTRAECNDHDNLLLVICPDCGYEPPWLEDMMVAVCGCAGGCALCAIG